MQVSVEKPGSPAEVLEHFGTKGMRWGVRKAVDKSIGTKTAGPKPSKPAKTISDRKERRAKGHDVRAGLAQKRIDEIQAKPKTWAYAQHQRNNQVKELEKFRDRETKAAKDIRAGHMTDFQKHAAIGVGAVAVVLATYGTYKMIDSGTAHQLISRSVPMKTNDLLSRKMSPDSIMKEVVKPINPGYGSPGTKMNCRRCTFAYELRRRGMDVKATNTLQGTGQTPLSILKATDPNSTIKTGRVSTLNSMVKEALVKDRWGRPVEGPVTHFMKEGNGLGKTGIFDDTSRSLTPSARSATIFKALSKNPEGARGELGMSWHSGGAHSMAWEIIGGKPVIFDTQSGEHFTQEAFDKIAKSTSKVSMTRLDDIPLNTNFLGKWVRNVK